MDILTAAGIALTLFLIANPVGMSPTVLALIKDYPLRRQQKIVFREAMISLLIALFFQYFGERFLKALNIQNYALTLTGGIVLFTIALQMIFHKPEPSKSSKAKQEPYIVPIAIPLISGPGLMTIIMIKATEEESDMTITLAILIAWIGVTMVLVTAPYLQKFVGKRGMDALEQVMGLILGLISIEMIIQGSQQFLEALK